MAFLSTLKSKLILFPKIYRKLRENYFNVHRMKKNVYRRNHKAMAQIVLVGRDSDTRSRPTEAYKLDFCIACSRKDNLKNLKLF